MKNKVTTLLIALVAVAGFSCEDEIACDADENGSINGDCRRVVSRARDYKSDGETFETIKLSFISGTGTSDLVISDSDGLIEAGEYTTASYHFSGRSQQNRLVVYIGEVNRENGNTISGSFIFEGTYSENYQSYDVEKTGSFSNVSF